MNSGAVATPGAQIADFFTKPLGMLRLEILRYYVTSWVFEGVVLGVCV